VLPIADAGIAKQGVQRGELFLQTVSHRVPFPLIW
jgi:hypothetical protein